MDPLRIFLFGGFLLQRGEVPLPPIPSLVGRSLFAYLVMHRDRSHTRDLLAGTFWPEMPESRARRRLSHTLWQIQSVLGEAADTAYLETTANSVRFDVGAPYWLDVEEFEQALLDDGASRPIHEQVAALKGAVALYRGDFLAGFYDDDWADVDRERLAAGHLKALGRLVQLSKSRADYEDALVYARRIVAHDPLQEDAHREVMRLCSLLGRANEAIQAFERCREILADEFGAEPSAATVALHEEIVEMRSKGTRPFTPSPRSPLVEASKTIPLVGREDERVAIVARLEEVLSGHGGAVLIEGEAGAGKTRMMQEAAEDAHWRGLGVLWGGGRQAAPRPYAALRQALEGGLTPLRAGQLAQAVDGIWLREVSRVAPRLAELIPDLPRPARLKAEEEPDRMREALARTFLSLGSINPTVVFIDDLQWADEDTVQALVYLSARLEGSGVLLCIGYRSDEVRAREALWQAVRTIDGRGSVDRLVLQPLDGPATAELVRRSMGWADVDASLVDGLYQETGGNPFFMLETLRVLYEEQVYGEDQPSPVRRIPVAAGVSEIIDRRLESLDTVTMAVLEAVAVQGSAPGADLPALRVDRPVVEVLAAFDGAVRRGLLISDRDDYRFANEQVQRVVYERIPAEVRRSMHERTAAALERSAPEDVEALAHHHHAAGRAAAAVTYLHRAAQRALDVYAYETASRHLADAVDVLEDSAVDAASRFEVLATYEHVLDVLGRRTEQEHMIDQMEAVAAGREQSAVTLRRRAWLYAQTDRFTEAEATAGELLAEGGPGRGAALRILGMALTWSGRPGDAVPYLEAAVNEYRDEPAQEADARHALGIVLSDQQRYPEAMAQLEGALERYERVEDVRGKAEVQSVLGTIHAELGSASAAETAYRSALAAATSIGYRRGEAVNLGNLGVLYTLRGRVGEALQAFAAAAEVFRDIDHRSGEAWVLANSASLRHSIIGDDDRAAADVAAALEHFRLIEHPRGEALCMEILGGIACRRGDLTGARRHYETALELFADAGDRWAGVQLSRSFARLEIESGDPEGAVARIDAALRLAEQLGMADQVVSLVATRGLALLSLGDFAAAYEETARSYGLIHPGTDQAYLGAFWHSVACAATGRNSEALLALDRAGTLLDDVLSGLDGPSRVSAVTRVPEHVAITGFATALRPEPLSVRLPAVDAPTGRPLRDDEYVVIVWTTDALSDLDIEDGVERRRARLVRLIAEARSQGGAPTVDDLAAALTTSTATVRRDLAALRRAGIDAPTRGSRRNSG